MANDATAPIANATDATAPVANATVASPLASRGADVLASAFSRPAIAGAVLAGVFAIAVPWCELPRDNPLPAEFDAATPGFELLVEALRRHDHACRAADLAGWCATVTADHLAAMRRKLEPVGRPLDGAALHDYAGTPETALEPLLGRPLHGTRAAGASVRIAVEAAADAPPRADAHEISFEWTGSRFVLDAVVRTRR